MRRRNGHVPSWLTALAVTGALAGLAVTGCSSSPAPAATPPGNGAPSAGAPPTAGGGTAVNGTAAGGTAVGGGTPAPVPWATATSAAAGGGMSALVAAAKKEGTLTVIRLLPIWANYGALVREFSRRYGIRVRSIAPGDTSPQEIAQIIAERGTGKAADVLDVESAVASAHAGLFAPYKVATWGAIPAGQKAPDGAWAQDYGWLMSVGYDAGRFGTLTSIGQLLGPRFRRAVALAGDPVRASIALYAVMMAGLAQGGSASDIAPGVRFFRRLAAAGNFLPGPGNKLTILDHATPVLFTWNYLNTAEATGLPTWKSFVPAGAAIGAFNAQAINKDAPHPAAARLWEEFLYSQGPLGGQNMWLKAGLLPVEAAAMRTNKTLDAAAAAKLPPITGAPVLPTQADLARAARYVRVNWPRAMG